MKFLLMFIGLSIINVVFSTIRSITTIKSGKTVASLISGGYFAFYNIMLIYTVADFPMWQKCLITFVCNVVGVWVVKFIEQKLQKDKLWQITITIPKAKEKIADELLIGISHSKIELKDYNVYTCYCPTQKDTLEVTNICKTLKGKMFATENKLS